MTFTIRDVKTGKEMDLNVHAGNWLRKLNFGLFRKVVSIPSNPDDCQIVARNIRNKIHLLNLCTEDTLEKYGIEKQTTEFLNDMKEVAIFLENAEFGISFPNIENHPLHKTQWHKHCFLDLSIQLDVVGKETGLVKKRFSYKSIKATSLFSLKEKIKEYMNELLIKDSIRK